MRVALTIAVPALLVLRHGMPSDSSRSWIAFSQHYALRAGAGSVDPWTGGGTLMGQTFGSADSLWGAFLANPGAIAHHFALNAITSPVYAVASVFPAWFREPGATLLDFAVVAVFAATVAFIALRRLRVRRPHLHWRSVWGWISQPKHVLVIFSCAVLALPLIWIYPRMHYFSFFAAGAMVLVGVYLGRKEPGGARRSTFDDGVIVKVVSTALIAVLALNGVAGAVRSFVQPPPVLDAMSELQKLPEPIVMLSNADGIDGYLPGMQQVLPELGGGASVSEFFADTGINAVYLTDRLRGAGSASLTGFDEFLADPAAFGFQPIVTGSDLLVAR